MLHYCKLIYVTNREEQYQTISAGYPNVICQFLRCCEFWFKLA